jgi:hypothetical protein
MISGAMRHFVYQRVHTLGGKARHLSEHLALAARTYEQIYGVKPEPDERKVAASIAETLHRKHPVAQVSATAMLYFYEAGDGSHTLTVNYERPLLETGYAHSPLRPRGVTFEYSIPFGGLPTNFQIEAQALFDSRALRLHGATRSVRREGDRLLSCGDSPLFAIRGRTLIAPPTIESVERGLVVAAAVKSRLGVCEEPILHSELMSFDELFVADAAGVTSLSECDGAKFMSLTAARIAAALTL